MKSKCKTSLHIYENEIKAIIRGENQRRTWRAIDQGLGKARTPAPTMVETEGSTGRAQHRTTEGVESAIHDELDARFDRASSAPICNGPLFELLGYNADTNVGMEILEGTTKRNGPGHDHNPERDS